MHVYMTNIITMFKIWIVIIYHCHLTMRKYKIMSKTFKFINKYSNNMFKFI